jgi:hypothetical protein
MMSLSDIASVYSDYSEAIGLSISDGLSEYVQNTFTDSAFVYLYPASDVDYKEKAEEFISSAHFANYAITAKKIDCRGVAFALASFGTGIYADLHSLPELDRSPELSHLATEGHGRYIIATKKADIGYLSALAESYSLKCVYFARGLKSDKFTLRKVGRTQMELDTSLILAFGDPCIKADFYCDEPAYRKAELDVIEAIIPPISEGASLQDIFLSASYEFPRALANSKKRGECVSSILGAYKAAVELCVAASTPEVAYTDTDAPMVTFSAISVKDRQQSLENVKSDAFIYLLSFNKDENGKPDYASLRGMCKTVKTLVDNGTAIYTLPMLDTLKDAVDLLVKHLNVGIYKDLPLDINDKLTGILVISETKIENALPLGMVRPPVFAANEALENKNAKI